MAKTKEMIKLEFERLHEIDQHNRLEQFLSKMRTRREVKTYSNQSVPKETLEKVILSAGTSPSGANQQPWSFVLISDDKVKRQIGTELEEESAEIIEQAPHLVALFKQKYGSDKNKDGEVVKVKHYYPNESTGICGGFFIAALNQAGLNYNLHSPVKSLSSILERPENEEPFLLFSIGIAETFKNSKIVDLEKNIVSDSPFTISSVSAQRPDGSENPPESSDLYYDSIRKRRNVRDFSTDPLDKYLLEKAFSALEASPFQDSYRFAVLSNEDTKIAIRETAEAEEKKFYEEKITEEWRDVLKPLGTNWEKKHLTDAPYLIVGFKVNNQETHDTLFSSKARPIVSSAVNTGILMSAIHHAGLCMLTHTPSPMTFLRDLLDRPKNELPIVVVPVGYPADDCEVPNISKKHLKEIMTIFTESDGETA